MAYLIIWQNFVSQSDQQSSFNCFYKQLRKPAMNIQSLVAYIV